MERANEQRVIGSSIARAVVVAASLATAIASFARPGIAQADPVVHAPGFCVRKVIDGLPRFQAALAGGGSWGSDLYACLPDLQRIEKIDAGGARTPFANLAALIPAGTGFGPWWPTFDRVGNFGFDLFVVEDPGAIGATDGIFRVSAAGTAAHFTESLGLDADTLGFDGGGAMNGDLFLAEGSSGQRLLRIQPNGSTQVYATAVADDGGSILGTQGAPFGDALYVARQLSKKILRIPSTHVPGAAAPVFVDFALQGSNIQPTDLDLAPGGAFGASLMYVGDASTGTIVQLDSTGAVVGTFLTMPQGGSPRFLFSTGGSFGLALIVYEFGGGTIWAIEPMSGQVPVAYCTGGTTTHACNAALASSGTPSATASFGFTIDASGVEGQKSGLFFYGLSGRNASPWFGGSSFLCVKAPTQRMTLQVSGGTAGACDGSMSVDWNAYMATHPSALGQPLQAGRTVNAQAWFRDPPAPGGTHLSDGLEFCVLP